MRSPHCQNYLPDWTTSSRPSTFNSKRPGQGEVGPATEVLITANIGQAILDSRSIFLVNPEPDSAELASLLDTGRQVRWVSKGTAQGDWVDSFARFLLTLRASEHTAAKQSMLRSKKNNTKSISPSLPKNRRKAS